MPVASAAAVADSIDYDSVHNIYLLWWLWRMSAAFTLSRPQHTVLTGGPRFLCAKHNVIFKGRPILLVPPVVLL